LSALYDRFDSNKKVYVLAPAFATFNHKLAKIVSSASRIKALHKRGRKIVL